MSRPLGPYLEVLGYFLACVWGPGRALGVGAWVAVHFGSQSLGKQNPSGN